MHYGPPFEASSRDVRQTIFSIERAEIEESSNSTGLLSAALLTYEWQKSSLEKNQQILVPCI